jgi:uncharacterized protein DUF5674
MKQVDKISIAELKEMAEKMYGDLVKADVDVARKVVIVDMEMHADGEAELLQSGSKQADLWGLNLYPAKFSSDDFIEFDSMINLKPRQNNMTRGVEDPEIQKKIRAIISGVVHE